MPVPIQELQNIIKNNDIARNEMFDFEDKIEDHAQQNREFFLLISLDMGDKPPPPLFKIALDLTLLNFWFFYML